MKLRKALLCALLAVGTAAAVLALEYLLQYQWLGRHWQLSRMWVNLLLLTLLWLSAIQVPIASLMRKTVTWAWAAGFAGTFALNNLLIFGGPPLLENPSINWAGGQQAVYIIAISALALAVSCVIDVLRDTGQSPPPPKAQQPVSVVDELAERRKQRQNPDRRHSA